MKLLITPSNPKYLLALYDTESKGLELINARREYEDNVSDDSRPPIRPFGITWDSENLFVANRSNLIVMDRDYKAVDVVKGLLDQNTHQIAHKGGTLVATMTRKDCLMFLDLNDWSSKYFHPYHGWMANRPDDLNHLTERHHINSVVWKGRLVYMMLNNRGVENSRVAILDLSTGMTEWIVELDAVKAHNILLSDEGIGTLDTGVRRSLLIKDKSYCLYTSERSFCRGMAGTRDELVCSHFQKSQKRFRGEGGSMIAILRRGQDNESRFIDGIGAINDMRLVDGEDHCHFNEDKYPASLNM